MLPEDASDKRGSWEIVVGPRDHHERFADAGPHLAEKPSATPATPCASWGFRRSRRMSRSTSRSSRTMAGRPAPHVAPELRAVRHSAGPAPGGGGDRRGGASHDQPRQPAPGARWPRRRRRTAPGWSSPMSGSWSWPRPPAAPRSSCGSSPASTRRTSPSSTTRRSVPAAPPRSGRSVPWRPGRPAVQPVPPHCPRPASGWTRRSTGTGSCTPGYG